MSLRELDAGAKETGPFLIVNVMGGRNIKSSGKEINPFVSVTCENVEERTTVQRKTASPAWNIFLQFPLRSKHGDKEVSTYLLLRVSLREDYN
jgi:hypothetical protein